MTAEALVFISNSSFLHSTVIKKKPLLNLAHTNTRNSRSLFFILLPWQQRRESPRLARIHLDQRCPPTNQSTLSPTPHWTPKTTISFQFSFVACSLIGSRSDAASLEAADWFQSGGGVGLLAFPPVLLLTCLRSHTFVSISTIFVTCVLLLL